LKRRTVEEKSAGKNSLWKELFMKRIAYERINSLWKEQQLNCNYIVSYSRM
jgi:hypothetical protein